MRQQFSISKCIAAAAAAFVVLAAAAARADEVQLSDTAPDRYVVKKGDTLWGIAGRFLKQPWRWPEIWRLNRDQIKNPHWIYPGDVVVLDRSGGAAQLRLERTTAPGNTVRISPTIRVEPLGAEATPSLPSSDIEPFLSKPLITGPEGLEGAPQIVAGRNSRVVRGEGDVIYVTGLDPKGSELLYIYRAGRPLASPVTGEVLGYEQRYVGTARVERFAEVSSVRIVASAEEILVGDRLVPPPREQVINYAPHPPAAPVDGRIIATARDSIEVGSGWVVTLDRGARDGLDVGTVLAVYRGGASVRDPRPSNEPERIAPVTERTIFSIPDRPPLDLPEERAGLVFVFRVFDRVSYALVLGTTDPVAVGDSVRTP